MKQTKKNIGRPSQKKTHLAVLRSMLTVPAEHKGRFLKKKGHYEKERMTLPVVTVAKWLNIRSDSVRSMERGRRGYRVTEEHAEVLARQFGVSNVGYFLGAEPKPLNWRGEDHTQRDFDNAQKALAHPDSSYDVSRARAALIHACAKVAAIVLRGFERGKPAEYGYKLNKALQAVYFDKGELPKDKKPEWPPPEYKPEWWTPYIAAYGNLALERPDLSAIVLAFEARMRAIRRQNRMPCLDCLGQGVIACDTCKAKCEAGKFTQCRACKNHRIIKCEACNGTGLKKGSSERCLTSFLRGFHR